jgi:diguanylate cyclase (GGDEF)-like protein/PAS domain S-box-containing protein
VTEGASSGGVSREQVDALYARIAELDGEVARLQAILRQAGDIIITTDLDGRVIDFNEEAEQVLGYRAVDVLGKPAESFYHRKRQRRKLIEKLEQAPKGSAVRADVLVRTASGKRRWLGLSLSWLRDAGGERVGTVGVAKDVTQRRALEDELRRLSITDEMTGLYNQSHFFHRLEVEKERAIRLDHELALVLFDLDGFKQLNDTRGHREGDEVLRQIGSVLFRSVRKGVDSAFRYGGDEFTVLLPGAAPETSVAFAERVRKEIEALDLGVCASMGLCAFDRSDRSLPIVERADAAMYLAKRQGGNRVARYDPSAEAPQLVLL